MMFRMKAAPPLMKVVGRIPRKIDIMTNIDKRILAIATQVTKKRPKTMIDHIIKHGHITTEEIRDIYGYNHPPRAMRDVREEGVPIETYRVEGSDGRKIAAYRFGNPDDIERHKLGGRKVFSKQFKKQLIEQYRSRCAITSGEFKARYLQIDHRVPYEVAGEEIGDERTPDKFMLLSGSAQRQKSWSCENCENLSELRDIEICQTCYWASPEEYSHIAMEPIRRVDIVWSGEEIEDYGKIDAMSKENKKSIQDYIKDVLRRYGI